jgi:hypothetical protein
VKPTWGAEQQRDNTLSQTESGTKELFAIHIYSQVKHKK